jgi:hypothetical protein
MKEIKELKYGQEPKTHVASFLRSMAFDFTLKLTIFKTKQ